MRHFCTDYNSSETISSAIISSLGAKSLIIWLLTLSSLSDAKMNLMSIR